MSTVYKKDFDYPVEAGRYRLAVSYACPFAHRAIIVRNLLGLEEAISESRTSNIKTDKIWGYSNHEDGKDPVFGVEYLSEIYKNTDSSYEGPFSVPALVDTTDNTVVNQESLDIIVDFATRFKDLQTSDVDDLYPEDKRADIDAWFEKAGNTLIGAPFLAGQAEDQETYDKNVEIFYDSLKEMDSYLEDHDYLVGDQLSLADVVAYTPLVRMDVLYMTQNGINLYSLQDFPNLWDYMYKLHQIPAFKESTDFQGIKEGSYLGKNGRETYTKRQAVPNGPDLSMWD